MLWEREKKKNGGGVRLGAEREEEGADRIYSENCAPGAGQSGGADGHRIPRHIFKNPELTVFCLS